MAFKLWMKAPMPMVAFFKKIDITPLAKYAKRHHVKFNMLMCYCIGKAAKQISEFRYLPVGEKLMEYDKLAINTIILNKDNSINSCDIPYSDNLYQINSDYLKLPIWWLKLVQTMMLQTVWLQGHLHWFNMN